MQLRSTSVNHMNSFPRPRRFTILSGRKTEVVWTAKLVDTSPEIDIPAGLLLDRTTEVAEPQSLLYVTHLGEV